MERKKRTKGKGAYVCRRCKRKGYGIIRKYNLYLCRACFREIAKKMGWEKYS